MQQVQAHLEARQEQGGADGGDKPGQGQQEQQGAIEGGEKECGERQHESQERGGEPGVEREGGEEEGGGGLANRHDLQGDTVPQKKKTWRQSTGPTAFITTSYWELFLSSAYRTRVDTQGVVRRL